MTTTMPPPSALKAIAQWPDLGDQAFCNKRRIYTLFFIGPLRKYPGIRGTDADGRQWWVRIGRCRDVEQTRYDAFAFDASALNRLATAAQTPPEESNDPATRQNFSALTISVAFLLFDLLAEEVRQSPDSAVCTLDVDAICAIISCDERARGNAGMQLLTSALDVLARLQVRKVSISQQATELSTAVAKPLLRYKAMPSQKLKVTLNPWFHAFLSPHIQ